MSTDTTTDVLAEIHEERQRQDAKWGEQNHPLLDPILRDRGPHRMASEYEVPHADRARTMCQWAATAGTVTWGHILVEEVAEFVCAPDVAAMRAELVQIAAVAVAAIEYIERHAEAERAS